jgi:hypothetical protein
VNTHNTFHFSYEIHSGDRARQWSASAGQTSLLWESVFISFHSPNSLGALLTVFSSTTVHMLRFAGMTERTKQVQKGIDVGMKKP